MNCNPAISDKHFIKWILIVRSSDAMDHHESWVIQTLSREASQTSVKKSFWYHLRHIVPWFLDMTSMLHITLAQVSSVTQLWSWETRPRWPNQCTDSLSLSYWQARVLIPSSIQVLNCFKSKLNIGNGLGYLNNLCGQSLSHFVILFISNWKTRSKSTHGPVYCDTGKYWPLIGRYLYISDSDWLM